MRRYLSFASILLAVLLSASASSVSSAQGSVTLDPNHTTTNFAAKHLLISTVQGNIPVKSASLTLGEDNIPKSVEAVMDLTKVDTRNEKRDDDLRSDKFFDVAHFPEMTFKSTKITPQSTSTFLMIGDLTIHGITKPIAVNGTLDGTVKDKAGHTHIGYAAGATIDRRDWGIGANVPSGIVGDDITITIEAEAIVQ